MSTIHLNDEDNVSFPMKSAHSEKWHIVNWAIVGMWSLGVLLIMWTFVNTLLEASAGEDVDIGIVFILFIFVTPPLVYFARRFAIDASHHAGREIIVGETALGIHDPVWLEGLHELPYALIDSARPVTLLAGEGSDGKIKTSEDARKLIRHAVMDLSFKKDIDNQVLIEFKGPVTFQRSLGPLLFTLTVSELDPGDGHGQLGVIVDVSDTTEFLDSLREAGLTVIG